MIISFHLFCSLPKFIPAFCAGVSPFKLWCGLMRLLDSIPETIRMILSEYLSK